MAPHEAGNVRWMLAWITLLFWLHREENYLASVAIQCCKLHFKNHLYVFMYLLLWELTLEDIVLRCVNFTVVYYNNNVGILGDPYLASFSLLPEFWPGLGDRTKSQPDRGHSIIFVMDKLDSVTLDL